MYYTYVELPHCPFLCTTAADPRNASCELPIDYINLKRENEVFIQVSFPVSTSSFLAN